MKNAKNKWWGVKDYVLTLLLLTLHVIIVVAFCLLTVYLNGNGKQDFVDFFTNWSSFKTFSNLIVEMIILGGILYVYFALEEGDFLFRRKNSCMLFLILEISLVANYLVGRYLGPSSGGNIRIYARPVALAAILSLYLIGNRRSAIFVNIVTALTTFVMDLFTNSNVEFTIIFASLVLNFASGIIAVYALDGITKRFRIFLMGVCISLPTVVSAFALEFMSTTSISDGLKLILFSLGSGVLSVVLMVVILPFFEIVFNVVTDFRLSEITSTDYKYMKELREQAPGTFNHCLTVASLAENCAAAIGENILKARAAAYYHDLGKLKEPEFFAENQKGYNPLEELSPELATDIIRSHARVGSEFIKERNLPEFLSDVASEHHGTLPIKYFFAKAKKYTENEIDLKDFSYPGPKPQSKIAAIIMICDASEAKVRTMNDRSGEKVDKAIKDIIEERMELEQFTDCDITLKELEIIRQSIVQALAGVYHSRVKYPKLKIKKEDVDD